MISMNNKNLKTTQGVLSLKDKIVYFYGALILTSYEVGFVRSWKTRL